MSTSGTGYGVPLTFSHPKTKVLALLLGGFALVLFLLMATGKRGLDALGELETGTVGMLSDERANAKAVTSAQDLEIALDQIYYSVPSASRRFEPDALRSRIGELEAEIEMAANESAAATDERVDLELWREFEVASRLFLQATRTALDSPIDPVRGQAVTDAHERVANAVGQMVRDSDRRNQRLVTLDHAAFARALSQHVTFLALALVIAFIVAGCTVFLVDRLFKRLEWQRRELSRLSSDMLKTQEATLRQVSHDLHDQVGQTLTAIEANLSALNRAVPDERPLKARIEDCTSLVKDLMEHARGMSQLLRPSILDDFGLGPSLEWLADRFSQRSEIKVEYTSNVLEPLPDDAETHLFRIAQEALTNIARHSGATKAVLSFKTDGGGVELTVSDNGRGLSTPPTERQGMGLRNMRARARQIDGELSVGSGPEGGTRIRVWAPIPRELQHDEDARLAG